MLNAPEALASHLELLNAENLPAPAPRSIAELRRDPEIAADLRDHIVAVVPYDDRAASRAAE